jgi:putative membrane protein
VAIPRPPLRQVVAVLGVLFLIEFTVLAISPFDRGAWLLENVLVFAGVALLIASGRRFPLSRLSYSLIFAFLCLHEIGSHYTYSLVPYDAWSRTWLGFSIDESFGSSRNHFDRVIHFAYGLLLAYPVREFYVRIVDARGAWGYVLPLGFVMSTSMIYELIEWWAAVVFGGDLGEAYLGSQGDIWDAHWDMSLATFGAGISLGLTLVVNASLRRDFAREWAESLSVKSDKPLGEEALAELLEDDDPGRN